MPRESIDNVVGKLAGSGLIRPVHGVRGSDGRSGTAGTACDVVVITADRPAALTRCLASLVRDNERATLRRVVVVDGSQRCADNNRSAVRQCGLASVEYFGREEAMALRSELVVAGFPSDVVAFGLTPGSIGCNRNLATLITAGNDVVMVDDDVVLDPWVSPSRSDGVIYSGHRDLREWEFFSSRRLALEGLCRASTSVIRAHNEVLNRRLSALVANEPLGPALRDACVHAVAAVGEGRDPTVRVTVAGLAGDSGRYCPYRLLLLNGEVQRRLMSDGTALANALGSREIRHIAAKTLVTHDPGACASYCFGVANRSPLLPFMPIGRGEDTVFGVMVGAIDDDVLFGHLPVGIVHDSDRPSCFGEDRMPSARQVRLSEFILGTVSDLGLSSSPSSKDERSASLVNRLKELGSLGDKDLRAAVEEVGLDLRARHIRTLEAGLARKDCPRHWRTEASTYRDALRESAASGRMSVLAEFGSPDRADRDIIQGTRDFFNLYAELLRHWPEIWSRAVSMRHTTVMTADRYGRVR